MIRLTNDVAVAREWATAFAEMHDEVRAMYLVGSRAKGSASADSDWDFVVVSEPVHGLTAFEGLDYGWLTPEDAASLGIAPPGVPVDVIILSTESYDEDDREMFLRFDSEKVWPLIRGSLAR